MIGDIDLLFYEKDFYKAVDVLKKNNYYKLKNEPNYFKGFRHYSRLIKDDSIAAVEIHKEATLEKYRKEFNTKMIGKDARLVKNFSLLSYENQLSLSIISIQINDYGFDLKKFSLRNAYDVLLLSKKINAKKTISKFTKLKTPLNCFLANCNLVFGDLETLSYFKTKESEKNLIKFKKSINNEKSSQKINLKPVIINLKRRFIIICKSISLIQ